MLAGEWSRSRYWLCHFLNSRHLRPKINWHQASASTQGHEALATALALESASRRLGGQALVNQVMRRCAGDPAYVQALRLLVKERDYHALILEKVRHRLGGQTRASRLGPLWFRTAAALGARFELSALLLSDLIESHLMAAAARSVTDPIAQSACLHLAEERLAHAAFHAERLTVEFADFNFLRRNARRLRLRVMFAWMLTAAAWRQAPLIRAAGMTRRGFVVNRWRMFGDSLERMVPYHRDALLAAMTAQKQHPYQDARGLRV